MSSSTKTLAFKVTNTTAITVYGATTSSSKACAIHWAIYKADKDKTEVLAPTSGATATTNTTCTVTKSGLSANDTYIVSINGGITSSDSGQDCVIYAIKFEAPNSGAPTINTQPTSEIYETGDTPTELSVAATASSGALSYQWYSNTTSSTEGASLIPNATSSTYTPDVSIAGLTYYYCEVKDDNGTTNSNIASIFVVDAYAPSISFNDNTITLIYGGSGTVYYTTDGTEPSDTNGKKYIGPFTLSNSCTIRAITKKESNYSEITNYDCYIAHDDVLSIISEYSGTKSNSDKTWTGKDGFFTITLSSSNETHTISQAVGFNGNDALKLNHGDTYTIQPDADIKVTKIVVVGETWLLGSAGNAASIAFSGFTPASGTFYDYTSERYIKSIEFISSTHDYGEAITMTPSNNQIGAYIEIYGVKRNSPADPQAVAGTTTTWDFTSSRLGSITTSTSNTLSSTSGTSMNIVYIASSSCSRDNNEGIKAGGKTNVSSSNWTDRYFVLQIAKSGTLSITSGSQFGEYQIYKGASSTFSSATSVTTITTTNGGTSSANITYNSKNPYIFIGFTGAKRYTKSISWTPATDDITLTTSLNMEGWRSFYDASQGYTVDANTTVYVATAKDASTVTLTAIDGGIPSGTPVILKTSSSTDNYKMTLTKATRRFAKSTTNGNLQT